jgi:hypothetical protein
VRHSPARAGSVRPPQALPQLFRRRCEDRLKGTPAMQTVSESVSKTVSAEYPRIIQHIEGILWNSMRKSGKIPPEESECGHESHPLRHRG